MVIHNFLLTFVLKELLKFKEYNVITRPGGYKLRKEKTLIQSFISFPIILINGQRGGVARLSRGAHNPEVPGSNPGPATTF